ncbi:MAG TPA: trehalose-phosphatase [Silvibacterium sp.]|nr:trehalose-phosphatase [Silvibacterium sp.]
MQSKEIERSLPDSTALWSFFERLDSAPASALLLDYDGTLAPFHIDRNRAYPYPEAVPLIEKIVERNKTRVVVISGRPVAELKSLLTPLNLEMWGAHGLERVLPDGSYEQVRVPWHTLELLSQAKEWVIRSRLTSLAEIKPGGIAIHWRGLPEAEAHEVEERLLEGWSGLANDSELKLLRFESGIELRVAHPDKGDAVNSILKESTPDTSIAYLGDDLTDEDSFRALTGRGLTVLVRPERRQTAAQVWLRPPCELIEFLQQWLNRIS